MVPSGSKTIIGKVPLATGGGDPAQAAKLAQLEFQMSELLEKSVVLDSSGKISTDLLPESIKSPITGVNGKKEGDIVLNADDVAENTTNPLHRYFTEDRVLTTRMDSYVKPANHRDIQPTDTIRQALGLVELGVGNVATVASNAATSAGQAANAANNADTKAQQALNLAQNTPQLQGNVIPSHYLGGLIVDDIVEYTNFAAFPATGQAGKIYVDLADNNKQYRWSGSTYTTPGEGGLNAVTINGETGSAFTLTPAKIGLENVPNVDTRNPANITWNATYRPTTDAEKATWNGKQNALGFTPVTNLRKVNGKTLNADITLAKADIADLNRVDNTSDLEKVNILSNPIRVALDTKPNKIDETFVALPLVATTTPWTLNRNQPNKQISVDKSTKLTPQAPADGWKEIDGGLIYAAYATAGNTLTFEGVAPKGFPDATGGTGAGATYLFSYTYISGKLRWDAEYLEAVTTTPTVQRHYAQFDGADSVINIPHTTANDPATGDFTFAFWAKFGPNSSGVNEVIMEKGGASGVQAILSTGGTVRLGTGNTTAYYIQLPVHNDNTWRHYAMTYATTGGVLTAYIDGVEYDQKTAVPAPAANTSPFNLGARTGTTKLAYAGRLSAYRQWERVLTDAQVLADKNGTRSTTNLVQEHLASAATANDTSGSNNNGVAANGVVFGTE